MKDTQRTLLTDCRTQRELRSSSASAFRRSVLWNFTDKWIGSMYWSLKEFYYSTKFPQLSAFQVLQRALSFASEHRVVWKENRLLRLKRRQVILYLSPFSLLKNFAFHVPPRPHQTPCSCASSTEQKQHNLHGRKSPMRKHSEGYRVGATKRNVATAGTTSQLFAAV